MSCSLAEVGSQDRLARAVDARDRAVRERGLLQRQGTHAGAGDESDVAPAAHGSVDPVRVCGQTERGCADPLCLASEHHGRETEERDCGHRHGELRKRLSGGAEVDEGREAREERGSAASRGRPERPSRAAAWPKICSAKESTPFVLLMTVPNGIAAGKAATSDGDREVVAQPDAVAEQRQRGEQRDNEEGYEIDEVSLVDPWQVRRSPRRAAAGGSSRRTPRQRTRPRAGSRRSWRVRPRRRSAACAEGRTERAHIRRAARRRTGPRRPRSPARPDAGRRAPEPAGDPRVSCPDSRSGPASGRSPPLLALRSQHCDQGDARSAEQEPMSPDRSPSRAAASLGPLRAPAPRRAGRP